MKMVATIGWMPMAPQMRMDSKWRLSEWPVVSPELFVYPTVTELTQKVESVRLSGQGVVVGDLEQIERVDVEIDPSGLEALSDQQVAELLSKLSETEKNNAGKT